MDIDCFNEHILRPLVQGLSPEEVRPGVGKIWLHLHKSSVHNLQVTNQ
jgi:hypothetical protein